MKGLLLLLCSIGWWSNKSFITCFHTTSSSSRKIKYNPPSRIHHQLNTLYCEYHNRNCNIFLHHKHRNNSRQRPNKSLYIQLRQSKLDDRDDVNDVITKNALNEDTSNDSNNKNDETNSSKTTSDNTNNNNIGWIGTVVLPLWLVYISNQWSRSSIYYLVNFDTSTTNNNNALSTANSLASFTAMNIDIGFDETQYGILASVAFTSLFAFASLGAGFVSDRFNRKVLTLISVIGWSIATYGTAISESYNSVVVCRIAMGLACAFTTPTAYTFIRDNVPISRQATASSIYGTGVALGSGLASYTLVLDNTYGWRQALYIIAATGVISALATLVLLPDDDKKTDKEDISKASIQSLTSTESSDDTTMLQQQQQQPWVESIMNDIQLSFATDRAKWIYLGSFVRFCSGLCIGVWGAPYFRMTFSDHVNDYAYAQAAISAIGASVSGVAGGAIADQLSSMTSTITTTYNEDSDDRIGRRLWVPVVGSLLAAPTWYMAMHSSDSFEVSMAWLATEYLVAECWFGPTISTLQTTVGSKIGGTAQGIFTLTGAIANFAPSILGYLYGQAISSNNGVGGGGTEISSNELANLLSVAVCFGYIANAFCFGMAANSKPPPKVIDDKAL